VKECKNKAKEVFSVAKHEYILGIGGIAPPFLILA
jgi:hypothetical protein